MGWDDVSDTICPIARSLAVIGDRWTLLILRELVMGTKYFDDLQAQTGMSSHLLSQRLKRLEKDGVVERKLYSKKPVRYEYRQTEIGKELDPVILMLRAWGMKHCKRNSREQPAVTMRHKRTGKIIDESWRLPATGKAFTFDDVTTSVGKVFATEREEKRAAFRSARGLSV